MYRYDNLITIRALQDIYVFRTKVYEMASVLSVEQVQVSRLAIGISTYLRNVFQQMLTFSIETEVVMEKERVVLTFKLPNADSDFRSLYLFFDSVQSSAASHQITLSKTFFVAASETLFSSVIGILGQKSNEELVAEVQAKNIELEHSFADLQRTTQEKSRMENELNVAKDIQLSMLPLHFPAFPDRKDIDIYANLTPAKEVGGDFYDFCFLDEHLLYIAVGDVSGKGVPAALMMAVCKTLLKSRAGTDVSTAGILTHVNNEMAKDNKNYMFVTVFIAILDTQTGAFTYSNAGHSPTYIKKKNGRLVKLSERHGAVIAAMEDMSYGESTLQLEKGDIVFAYTDGVIEAHNSNDDLFTDQRLQQLLTEHQYSNPQKLVMDIVEEVHRFEQGTEQFDDITALCLEYKETPYTMHTEKFAINNKMEEIQVALDKFEVFASEHVISMATTMKVNVVFDELLSNIVKYGFSDKSEHLIDIVINLTNRKLVIHFSDSGIPFNPFQITPPDLSKSIEDREIGGLGIHLVRELMDEHSYKRSEGKNIVSMTKYNV